MTVNHLVLHPDVAFVHLPDTIDVFLANRANVKLLQALKEVLLLYLCLYLRPNLVQCRVVAPIGIRWLYRKRMLEHHNCENWLDDQVIGLNQVSELGILFEC